VLYGYPIDYASIGHRQRIHRTTLPVGYESFAFVSPVDYCHCTFAAWHSAEQRLGVPRACSADRHFARWNST
jgi:hypothetical protein